MISVNLTPKQLHILKRIRDLRIAQGYSPTMQEIADELDVSKVTVFEHVEALIKKGALLRQANKARSLEVNPDLELPDEQRKTRLPFVGTIAAGMPIEAIADCGTVAVPTRMVRRNTYALRVRGHSMINCNIHDGDIIIIERSESAENGETAVVMINQQEVTLKKLYIEKTGVRLQPANDSMAPIYLKNADIEVLGMVMGVVRGNAVTH